MNFNLFISWIWTVCYCMANERQVQYVSNSEKSDEHFILLDVHKIEKRHAAVPTTHMSHSAHVPGLTTSSTANHDSVSRKKRHAKGAQPPVETTHTTTTYSSHKYYNMTIHQNSNGYWDELYNHTKHDFLSNDAHLKLSGINITFTMPFYGHNISRLQLTTGGFIHTSPYVHRLLTHSHYVAPLMANFGTEANNSEILYKEYENESIVVEWRNVQLDDQKNHSQFTFQAKLFKNGTIMFVYKKIPVAIGDISTKKHPVKLGVADAYYYDFPWNGRWYRSIHRYHTVDIMKYVSKIQPNTVVILDPLPTCNTFTTCMDCVSKNVDFECSWCPAASRCSDGGLDWNLQKWFCYDCNKNAGNTSSICTTTTQNMSQTPIPEKQTEEKDSTNTAATVVPILLVLVIVGLVGGWMYYAFTHPNTPSGQWLIEHRPSQLKARLAETFKRNTETGDRNKFKNENTEIE